MTATQSPQTFLNGEIIMADGLEGLRLLKNPDVSAVVLDISHLAAFKEMQAHIDKYLALPPKSLRRRLGWIGLRPGFRHVLTDMFEDVGFNQGALREEINLSNPRAEDKVEADAYSFLSTYRSFKTAVVNLAPAGSSHQGLRYLITPVTEERYKRDLLNKNFVEAAAANPDLEWGNLAPGQVIIYKGGEFTRDNRPLIHAGPKVPHVLVTVSDAQIPMPFAH